MTGHNAFRKSSTWAPIAQYDRTRNDVVVLLRRGGDEALGYWGVAQGDPDEAWRHADEALDEVRIDFEPEEYAEVAEVR